MADIRNVDRNANEQPDNQPDGDHFPEAFAPDAETDLPTDLRDSGTEPESPEAWLARVDEAVANTPDPEFNFTPAPELPGPPPSEADRAVRATEVELPDGFDRNSLQDVLPDLLPLAVRLVKLAADRRKRYALDAALDALGYGSVREYDPNGENPSGLRSGMVLIPEDRQKVYDALSA